MQSVNTERESKFMTMPSIFTRIRVFSNELALWIGWPKYWSFSLGVSPSNEYSGSISFRMGWSCNPRDSQRAVSSTTIQKHQFFSTQLSLYDCPWLWSLNEKWLTFHTHSSPWMWLVLLMDVGDVSDFSWAPHIQPFMLMYVRSHHNIIKWKVKALVAQLYPTLCNPMGWL